MAKIILMADSEVVQEITLLKERITIGRRPYNDIVIDSPGVSAEHAVIVTILNDSYLEDLNSTNGTQINGQSVKKHFLQDNDVIGFGQYKLRYVAESDPLKATTHPAFTASASEGERSHRRIAAPPHAATEVAGQAAFIKVLNGASAGREIALSKALTTIGRPGVQVAVITCRPQGYSLTHVEGDCYPLINGVSIGAGAHAIAQGDVIDLSGTQMLFSLR
jgi:hypothetical protein